MAILSSIPGITVTVEVNAQALREYDDTEATFQPSHVTKYIESVPGSEFAARIHFTPKFVAKAKTDFVIKITLDGQEVARHAYQKDNLPNHSTGIVKKSALVQENEKWYDRMFTFTQLQTVSAASASQTKKNIANEIGQIGVHIYRCQYKGMKNIVMKSASKSESAISEKHLKGQAVSHASKLGRKKPAQSTNSCDVVYDDAEHQPYARYTFRYRSLADLKVMYIVPRTPTPSPEVEETTIKTLNDRDIESLSTQELRNIVRNMPVSGRVKRERASTVAAHSGPRYDDPDGEVEVVDERSAKRGRFTHPIGEVIDLSGLDDD